VHITRGTHHPVQEDIAMLARIRKAQDKESGFTLIELLVVIIIIGILAAIAIPTFLNQRQKGYKADMKSALKNAATAMESYATETGGSYTGTTITQLEAEGFKKSSTVTVAVVSASADAYCLSATDTRLSGTTFYYSSSVGTPGTTACS
jgi:type IV pilus assembly protein PilA